MKCPKCGYAPPLGRPKGLDDKKVRKLILDGWSLRAIAAHLGVTHGAVQASMKRSGTKSDDYRPLKK